ncbi:hypothetical protein [Zavarzinia aquatilis]|uniref:Uncharacterized protein n=1 Tax=Zavarzinia aquatilis TaxID=2211142 RepID=A0A317EC29_9PROT|nr:hypothetical protein [Zavarzinia aquatilis]PWR24281.1 hypothetical protein DKG74_09195 [Zavarzinia aquatilis]
MSLTDRDPVEGLDRWRALFVAMNRRETWHRRITAGIVGGLWLLYGAGVVLTMDASTGVGAFLGAAGLLVGLMPAMLLTGGLLLSRGWLARRAALNLLGLRRTPARDAFEPQLPVVQALVADMDRLTFETDERRRLESRFDRLAGVLAALQHLGAESDRAHARELAAQVPGTLREMTEIRRRALGRNIAGSLPASVSPSLLSGDGAAVPALVVPSRDRLEAVLGRAGQSDSAASLAAARRARDSAERALAALRGDIGLTLRTRDLLDGLAAELEVALGREASGTTADPGLRLEVEERLMKARRGEA